MVLDETEMLQEILEIRAEIEQSNQIDDKNKKYIKMLGVTFKKRFKIKAMTSVVIEKIKCILDKQDLDVNVKSGAEFGTQDNYDWIVFTLNPIIPPEDTWFDKITDRTYESEREIEAYFLTELLERLGYSYEDISIGYSIKEKRGSKWKKDVQADFVVFNGPGRDIKDVLLIVEAKSKDIQLHNDIAQVESYADILKPAYYAVTNGKRIIVYRFNGIVHGSKVLDFDVSRSKEMWKELYRYISKEATLRRKLEMQKQVVK